MSSDTVSSASPQIGGLCRPGSWLRMRPTLRRLGLSADAEPQALVDWLQAASPGSHHPADRALRTVALQGWELLPSAQAAGGGLTLRTGSQAWQLIPLPAHRPVLWKVVALKALNA